MKSGLIPSKYLTQVGVKQQVEGTHLEQTVQMRTGSFFTSEPTITPCANQLIAALVLASGMNHHNGRLRTFQSGPECGIHAHKFMHPHCSMASEMLQPKHTQYSKTSW